MFLKPDYSCQISSVLKVAANSDTSWKSILSLSAAVEEPKILQSCFIWSAKIVKSFSADREDPMIVT